MLATFGGKLICAHIAAKQSTTMVATNRSSTMTMPKCETEFDFTLLLDGIDKITPDVEDVLFTAGCDDATISLRFGRMYLTFSRSAASLKDAIISAIKNVRESGIDATVLRVDQCDLVTQSEIARRIHRSRQLVNQYITGGRGPGGFPGSGVQHHGWRTPLVLVRGRVLAVGKQHHQRRRRARGSGLNGHQTACLSLNASDKCLLNSPKRSWKPFPCANIVQLRRMRRGGRVPAQPAAAAKLLNSRETKRTKDGCHDRNRAKVVTTTPRETSGAFDRSIDFSRHGDTEMDEMEL